MRLDFFMLADSAAPAPDDPAKITITGVGITYLLGPEFPINVTQMACVARFLVEPEDRSASTPFRIQLRLRAPDGRETGESTVLSIPPDEVAEPDVHEDEERGIFFVVDLAQVHFDMSGLHQFELLLNQEVVGTRTLAVLLEQKAQGEATTEPKV